MREAVRREIGGRSFKITQLGFRKSRQVFVRLAKALGPSLALVADNAKSIKDLPLAGMLRAAIENIDDHDLEWLADVFGETSQIEAGGGKWPFLTEGLREEVFGYGALGLFFQWIWACLEVNYADFLGPLLAPKGGAPGDQEPKS